MDAIGGVGEAHDQIELKNPLVEFGGLEDVVHGQSDVVDMPVQPGLPLWAALRFRCRGNWPFDGAALVHVLSS